MALDFAPVTRVGFAQHKRKRETPLEYMLRVVNDETVPDERRDRMAVAAAPYCHPKVIDAARNKKAAATEAALTAGVGTTWANDLNEIRAQ